MKVNFVCETCGRSGSRCYAQNQLPSHFFCSRECQNEWQKTREDIVAKNKDPEFRKKVSEGLKRRKKRLGDNYHSPETMMRSGSICWMFCIKIQKRCGAMDRMMQTGRG